MKEEYIIQIMDYLDEPDDPVKQTAVQQLIAAGELSESDLVQWATLSEQVPYGSHPAPTHRLRTQVYDMLYKQSHPTRPSFLWRKWLQPLWLFRLAGSALILSVGVALGLGLRPTPTYETQIIALSDEVQRMREVMILTLLEQPSATQRLKAVSISTELSQTDEKISMALLKTLTQDPQVSVRLAALEALLGYADQPQVRQGLIEAIPQQDSPLMQITLAEVMVQLQEKHSVDELRALLQQPLNEEAEEEIKKSIQQLI